MTRDIKNNLFNQTFEDNTGFSLIEVILAISIFAIGILAIASMQITSIQGNASARYQSDRVTIAQDKLEELMALSYSHSDLSESGNPHTDSSPPEGFSVTWNIDDDNPSPGGKLVTVSVSSHGGSKTTTLVSVKPDM